MIQYNYDISGTTPENEIWEWKGTIDLRFVDDFLPMVQRAITETFAKVESGDAAGSAGTHIPGPYQITKLKLTAVAPDNAVAKSMAQAGTQRT
jgi:hypothetical protein